MIVYIDEAYKCHTENEDGRTAVEVNYFDGKCDEFIEGYRFVPEGQTWTRADGVEFSGQIMTPWKEFSLLDEAQREFERKELADMKAALAELGVE